MRMKLGLGLLMTVLLAAQTPEAVLGSALHQERVTGNLQAAIDGYRKVLASKGVSRSLAAQAQYHIGICYEKLGSQEARKAFESVVNNYADQKDLATQARARLAGMAGAPQGVRTRLLWDNAIDLWGRASADGRYLSFVDWSSRDLGVRDLVTGENRKLTNIPPWSTLQSEVEASAVSPDGKRIAFTYAHYGPSKDKGPELHVIGMDGKGQKVLMQGGGLDYVEPHSWSPDGKWIAAAVVYRNAAGEEDAIVLVSTDSGQVRRLPVKDKQWPYNVTFSPDGKRLAYSIRPSGTTVPTLLMRAVEGDGNTETVVLNNAFMMGWAPDGGGILFSRERGVTHDLYLLPVAAGKATGEPSPIYSSSDVGNMPAGVTTQGALLLKHYNRRSETLVLPWNGNSMAGNAPAFSMAGTGSISWILGNGAAHFSNDGKRLFSVTPALAIAIREMESGGERTITPQLKSWKAARWAHDNASLLVLGTGADGKSGVFRVDDATGKSAMLAELPKETWSFTPSRDGKTIYHGTPRKTQARDLATGLDKTLLEGARGGNYDLRVSRDGHRLVVRSSGGIVIVDLRTGQNQEIYRRPEASSIAIWALDWSADDKQLVTIVRPGGGTEKMESWIFSPEGGEPKRQPNPPELRGLSFSPDGKYVATTSQTQRFQVWALENFLPAKK
ncbi:MAG: PD40 domain-containing protein [Acidobacteriia bacterium]|nr:PD40 domain-containing protein [Terriglobia bacterium]